MNDDPDFALRRVFAQTPSQAVDGDFSATVMQRVRAQRRRGWILLCALVMATLLASGLLLVAAGPQLSQAATWLDALDRRADGIMTDALSLALGGLILWRARAFNRD